MFPFALPSVSWFRLPAMLDPLVGSLPMSGRVALAVAGYLAVALLAGAVTRWPSGWRRSPTAGRPAASGCATATPPPGNSNATASASSSCSAG